MRCVKISLDMKYLFTTGNDVSVKMWNLQTGVVISAFRQSNGKQIKSVALTQDCLKLFYASDSLVLVDLNAKTERTFSFHLNSISCAYNQDLKFQVLVGDFEKSVFAYYLPDDYVVENSQQMKDSRFIAHQVNIESIQLSQNSKYMVTGSADGQIKIWKQASLEKDVICSAHEKKILFASVIIAKDLIVSVDEDTIKLWDFNVKRLRKSVHFQQVKISSANINKYPDSLILVLGL